jgi:hypothetical protein
LEVGEGDLPRGRQGAEQQHQRQGPAIRHCSLTWSVLDRCLGVHRCEDWR